MYVCVCATISNRCVRANCQLIPPVIRWLDCLGDFPAKKTASPSFRQVQEHDQQPQCGRKKIMARHRAGPWKTQKRTSNASE